MSSDENPDGVEHLLGSPELASALESDRLKQFLDHVPVAIAVSRLHPVERIICANVEFERLTGHGGAELLGGQWDLLPGQATAPDQRRTLAHAIVEERDHIGAFAIPSGGDAVTVDAWSNIIEDDDGSPMFRLVALVKSSDRGAGVLDELEERVREKDVQLLELQHRVKNNLQMITALIRIEARGLTDHSTGEGFDRLAGRVEALGLLYRCLGDAGGEGEVDLGVYLSEIVSAVMHAHAVEGIHLNLQVDTWPVSIDIAMPTGLVVNELMTNSLKHAFVGRNGGTITLSCLTSDTGCQVIIADDGVGLPPDAVWPRPGKLSSMIVRSLLQNASASIDVASAPDAGMKVTITFRHEKTAANNP